MNVLNDLKLSQKLVLMLAIPILVLAYFAWDGTGSALRLKNDTAKLGELSALSVEMSSLVHELQKERGATAGFLGSKGEKFGPELAKQRTLTNEKAEALRTFLAGFDPKRYNEQLQNGLADALQRLEQIADKRTRVDDLSLPVKEALGYYTGMNGSFLGLISEMSKISPDEQLSIMTAAYANFLQSKERAGIERAVLSNTFASDAFAPGLYNRFMALVTIQNTYMDVFLSLADPEQIQFYRDTLKGEFVDETERMRQVARERHLEGGFGIDGVYWFKMQTGKINLLKQVEDRLAGDLKGAAEVVAHSAEHTLILTLIISIVGVGLAFLLGWVLARSIYRQLGGEPAYIAEIADNIAHGNLDTVLRDSGSKRTGIYASIVTMRDNLKARIERDAKAAAETLRIKTALDCVTTNVMVADDEFNIIYANPAVKGMFKAASETLRESIPGFDPDNLVGQNIDKFHKQPSHQRSVLGGLKATHESRVVVGGRTFRIIANPVMDPEGKRLGTAVEWADLTLELQAKEEEQKRLELERIHAAETARIKSALDNVSSCVMMANTDREIIYLNKAVQELFTGAEEDIRSTLPNFSAAKLMGASIDQFHVNPGHQAKLLDGLTQPYRSEMAVGGRTMRIIANPVFGAGGERIGTAVEWTDRTDEVAVEREVDGLVAAARSGDLSQRIELSGKHGFFRDLSEGMNDLLQVVERVFDDIAGAMGAMADGDLTQPIHNQYQGKFGEVKDGVNGTIDQLQNIVGQLRESMDVISVAAKEITAGNINLSSRTEQQASSLEETAASMEELTSTVRNNADNAQQANQLAASARQLAERGGDVVHRAVTAMDEINASSNTIADIVGVIDEIAFQTNLLALNASVEAARAGEQGRGFAVVATEVRNLAGRSATAAKEIKELIRDSVEKVKAGSALVHESGENLESIVDGVKKVGDIIAEIAAASAEQSAGIDQVNQAVTSMDEVTQQNAALAEETSAAAASMQEKSDEAERMMGFFKLAG